MGNTVIVIKDEAHLHLIYDGLSYDDDTGYWVTAMGGKLLLDVSALPSLQEALSITHTDELIEQVGSDQLKVVLDAQFIYTSRQLTRLLVALKKHQ